MQLEVGATTEQVTVQAEAAQIQTDKADTHTTITSQAIARCRWRAIEIIRA